MHTSASLTSLDMVLLMAPFAILLVSAMFGLDERFAGGPARRRQHRPSFCEVGRDGRGRMIDPDGNTPQRDRWPLRHTGGRGNRFVTRSDRTPQDRRAGLGLI
jgi:hypothetical protein